MALVEWPEALEAIRTAVVAATGLEDYVGADGQAYHRVEWIDRVEDSAWAGLDGAAADLELTSNVGWGYDETRRGVDDKGRFVVVYSGLRDLTVRVRIESFDAEPGGAAMSTLAGRLRTLLRAPSAQELLQAGNVSLVEILASVTAPYMNDQGREKCVAVTDIRFYFTEQYADYDSAGYVETAEIAAEDESEAQLDITVTTA